MVALPDPTSATNIIPFGPATDSPGFALPVAGCRCLICQAFTSPEAIDQLEIDIMDIVADLLDHGWVPEALVERVEELALRGPYACQIVTLAIVSHAGYWLSSPAMFDLLDDVDELAAGSHHVVGMTIPGWLRRYVEDEAGLATALNGTADVFEILPVLPCPSATPTSARLAGSVWEIWRRHR